MRLAHRLSLLGLVVAVAAATFFLAAAREESHLLDAFVERSLAGVRRADTTAVVLALAHSIHTHANAGIAAADLSPYERLESTSLFNMTAAVVLAHGAFGVIGHEPYGPCGPMTRVFLNACWRLGVPARKLQLIPGGPRGPGIHTLAEWRSGGRWQVISPSDDFVWHTHDGRIATVEEIAADSTVYAQVLEREPWFPYRFDHPRHVRWEKLPGPAQALARAVLGERRYRDMQTPRLYDQPRELLFRASALIALACALLALMTRARRTGSAPTD